MKFSIVTPSFRQLPWLKRCVRSVADQSGVELEHLIQDAGTGPELESWVRGNSNARLIVEPDSGMYDAINRALDRATGDICGILNCDEQYLPDTLARVRDAFEAHPKANVIAGDFLIVDPAMKLLSFRKVTKLRASMILTDHLYAFTCALFFRRRVFAGGIRFDSTLRMVADGEWVARVLAAGHKAVAISGYLSAFTFTGENQSLLSAAREEERRVRKATPAWMRLASPLLRQVRHVEKLAAGAYRSGPISYEVYAGDDQIQRTRLTCERPSWRSPW